MPYTSVTSTPNGRQAIVYALGGKGEKGHNGHLNRNIYISAVGMATKGRSFADQMDDSWRYASSRNKNQVHRIIMSFSKDELDPNDPKSKYIANQIAREFVAECYPDRQALICVQNDGEGGCIHCHILVSNVSITDHKGCENYRTKFNYIAKHIDDISKKYIDNSIDYDEKFGKNALRENLPNDKVSYTVKKMRTTNEKAKESGKEVKYIWQDDLKNRIRLAMDEAVSEESFSDCLKTHGVSLTKSGKSNKYGDYYTYELTDISSFPKQPKKSCKARSYNLGADFTPDALRKHLCLDTIVSEPVIEPGSVFEPTQEGLDEAKQFADWALDNGFELFKNGEYDLDADERARKVYKEFKESQKEPATAPLEEKKSSGRKATPSRAQFPKPEEVKHSDAEEISSDMLIQKLMRDAQKMNCEIKLPDDDESFDVK